MAYWRMVNITFITQVISDNMENKTAHDEQTLKCVIPVYTGEDTSVS